MGDRAEALRAQILDLVGQYSRAAFPTRAFLPGQSPVPVAGRVFDEQELTPANIRVSEAEIHELASGADDELVEILKKAANNVREFHEQEKIESWEYYAGDGIDIINFGPGSGAQGHAANESVPIAQMVEAATIQLDVVRRLVGMARAPGG